MRLPPRRQLARVIPLVCQESVEVVSQRRLRANEHRVGEVALEVSGGQTREGLVSPGAEFDESFDEFCKPLRRPRLGHQQQAALDPRARRLGAYGLFGRSGPSSRPPNC